VQECCGLITYKRRIYDFSKALLDKLMHAAALSQFIRKYFGKFFLNKKKIPGFIRKIHIGSQLECNDIPGKSNAGLTTCILREDKESIILFFIIKQNFDKTGLSTCLLEFSRHPRSYFGG
jgi:hypothetical protein